MAKAELTVSATEFKAKCLKIIDDLQAGRLKRVTVTKRGSPAAEMRATEAGATETPFWGFMKGRIEVNPDFDWSESVWDEEFGGLNPDQAVPAKIEARLAARRTKKPAADDR